MSSAARVQLTTETSSRGLTPMSSYLEGSYQCFQPLSSKIFHVINQASIEAHRRSSHTQWRGVVLQGAAKAMSLTGMALNSVVALVELVAAANLTLIASVIHLITGAKSEILQKYTLKCFVYGANSFCVLRTQLAFLSKGSVVKYSIADALIRGKHSYTSSVSAHAYLGYAFNALAGREITASNADHILIEFFESFSKELLAAAKKEGMIREPNYSVSAEDFFEQSPGNSLSLHEILAAWEDHARLSNGADQNAEHVQSPRHPMVNLPILFDNFVMQYLTYTQLKYESFAESAPEGGGVPLSIGPFEEVQYKKKLEGFTRNAFVAVYQDPNFVALFSENRLQRNLVRNGIITLTDAYEIISPSIARYAQFLEIQWGEITCPPTFLQCAFQACDTRRSSLQVAVEELPHFSPAELDVLKRQLLKKSFDVSAEREISEQGKEKVKAMYEKIDALAKQLYSGQLMSQQVISLHEPVEVVTESNRFERALKEEARGVTGNTFTQLTEAAAPYL